MRLNVMAEVWAEEAEELDVERTKVALSEIDAAVEAGVGYMLGSPEGAMYELGLDSGTGDL